MDKFCQFLWRPRPPLFLSHKQIKEIKKNLKKYSVEFDAIDKMKISEISKELLEKRQNARRDYDTYRKEREAEVATQKEKRLALRNGVDTDSLDSEAQELEEEVVEFLVNEEITNVDWDDDHSGLWNKSFLMDYTFWLYQLSIYIGRETRWMYFKETEILFLSLLFFLMRVSFEKTVKVTSFPAKGANACGRSRT